MPDGPAVEQFALEYPDGSRDELEPGRMTLPEARDHLRALRAYADQQDDDMRHLVATRLLRRTTTPTVTDWEEP